MRSALTALGVLLVASIGTDCGPGKPPMQGTITYSDGCTPMLPTHTGCPGENQFLTGQPGSGTPPLIMDCAIQVGDGGPSIIRFSIGRSVSGTLDNGFGVSVCGSIAGPNQDMTNTTVNLYFNGAQSLNNAAPGPCTVHIGNLTDSDFDGQMSCMNVQDTTTPSHYRYLAGTDMTADPSKADFNFISCHRDFITCPGH